MLRTRDILRRAFGKKFNPIHGPHCEIAESAGGSHADKIIIGDYVYIGPDCLLHGEGGLSIGDGSILAPRVVIWTSTHHYQQEDMLPYGPFDHYRPVTIGHGVWIGLGVLVVPGVEIGDGAVVAMGSVVVSNVGIGEVVGGNPARKISQRDPGVIKNLVSNGAYYLKKYPVGKRHRKRMSSDK